MHKPLYFDDFTVGQQFASESYTLEQDHAIAFARQYDPQYFHTDEQAAKASLWGRLVASGWQTAAIAMRLKTTTPLGKIAGGLIGLGIESIAWPRPVYPGDTLRITVTITDKRISASKPAYGIMKYKVDAYNQHHEPVMTMATAVWVPRA